jgi:tetratricopeptide (TPR) repeat protein
MYRKNLLTSLFIVSLIFAGSIAVSAQTFIVRGSVKVRQADGTTVPVPKAVIDTYRTDMNAKGPTATANAKGDFSIAGMFFGGTYMLVASGPGAAPKIIPNVKGSNQIEYDFVLETGDGTRMTQEQAFTMFKGGETSGPSNTGGDVKPSAEQIKAREDYEKKKAEYEAEKSKVENINKTVDRAFKDGNAAYAAKNYDLAITTYDEGINADPNFVGSAAPLLNNKATSLNQRGGDRYNKSVKENNNELKAQAKEDLANAYNAAKRSYELATSPEALADPKLAPSLVKHKYDALNYMAEALRLMTSSQLDTTRGEEITKVYTELMSVETVPEKKKVEQVNFANLLMTTGDFETSDKEFLKVLAEEPDNVDALAGHGLCLIVLAGDDKAKLQEGLNVLQHFVDVAPDTHKFKASSITTIEGYKNDQKMVPQKTPKTTPKKKP